MFDQDTLQQLKGHFSPLKSDFTLHLYADKSSEAYKDAMEMFTEMASTSDKISVVHTQADDFHMDLEANGKPTGVIFRGIPGGHEFTSLLLALLNHDGIGRTLPDSGVLARIKRLHGPIHLRTFVSLTCTNCPDVVQALNVLTMNHPDITHEMVDGAMNTKEADSLGIASVPTVLADGDVIHVGRGDLAALLNKIEEKYGTEEVSSSDEPQEFDVIIVGAGPAGSSAAIYTARKGLKVAMIAERVGGQVNETVGIENLISVKYTTGSELAQNLRGHIEANQIQLFETRTVKTVEKDGDQKVVTTTSGEVFKAPALIVATGASWRKLGVPGEKEYTGNGVAYCAHCDGPFFKDKRIAVVGGGNSGLEAAIDLANICTHVTVVEFMDTLKADEVLQKKAADLPNIDILLSTATKEIEGDGGKVTGITLTDRQSGEDRHIDLDGVFVQIGLSSNSGIVKDLVETNRPGEIVIDERCRTSCEGIYAAGDCSTVPYKQIVVAIGEGAKAALTAFDDRMRK